MPPTQAGRLGGGEMIFQMTSKDHPVVGITDLTLITLAVVPKCTLFLESFFEIIALG